jgi:hypothetical protein
MRPEKGARIEGLLDIGVRDALRAQTDCPLCGRVLLSLDSTQPGDNVCGFTKLGPRELLIAKAPLNDLQCSHGRGECRMAPGFAPAADTPAVWSGT